MCARLRSLLLAFGFIVTFLFPAIRSQATHIFGVDLYYTHVTGNTYTIHLVVYGDCSGAAFSSLPTSVPQIKVYNGATLFSTVNLAIQAPTAGVEVTPVCPADLDSTTCTNLSYPISGVKKFLYQTNVTVSGPSAAWRFLFQGNMGGGSAAGRSGSITNILGGGSTLVDLVDTLNNTTYDNSNAVYTTIPTPFFCLDVPANFNPGAVDPDGDSLAFFLVSAIDGTTGSPVTYVAPYTPTAPLQTTAGTFSFSSATGQMSFTPNAIQKSLVVYNVEEYNSGVLRGTSQREMTVVVITPCTNTPPIGAMSSPTAGTLMSSTNLNICNNAGAYSFFINPTDAEGNDITMTVAGLPAGATFGIVGNGGLAPVGTFSWSTTGVAPGSYIFYVTYLDNGCPLSGKQTIAYTVTVLPMPTEAYAPVSPATCVSKAVFNVTPGGSASPWTLKVIEAGTTVQTVTGVTAVVADSLVPGAYTIRMVNPSGCYVDTTITIISPPLPVPSVTTTPPLCPGGSTGTATISGSAGATPYTYADGAAGAYTASGTFTSLSPGSYTLYVKDANGCVKDTIVTVPNATPILLHLGIQKPLCDTFSNGLVTVNASNSVAPYTYALGTAGTYSSDDTFSHLGVGSYTLYIKNANGCIVDTMISLVDSETLHATLTIAAILCNAGNGTVTVNATGGYGPPYSYAYNSTPFAASDVFSLPVGTYALHVHDPNSCYFDTSITLTQPTAIAITPVVTNVACNGAATGSVIVNATGGTPVYLYNNAGGAYGASNTFSGQSAGMEIVSVKDANGCIQTDTVTLTQPTALFFDSVVMHEPSCNAGTNGSLTIYSGGGVSPYTYEEGSGAFAASSVFSSLSAGAYVLHIKDANGCLKDTSVTLLQPAAIVPSAFVVRSVCNTLANGKVTVSATGGTPGYTFALGTGTFSASGVFSPLAAGTYTFHIKDANSCTKDTVITVTDSLVLSATFIITPSLCYDQASGIITVTGTGGISPYVYAIGTGAYTTTHIFDSLLTGAYHIYLKDANGCKFDSSVTVTQPANLVPGISITRPSCHGYNDGSVTVSATGGTTAYAFSFDGSTLTATATYGSLKAGTDTVIIKDAHGCMHDTVFNISQPSGIYFNSLSFTDISCNGGSNGTVNVTGIGATPPYMYGINTGSWQAGTSFTGISAGIQVVKIEDANGCEIDTAITLTQPLPLVITGADTVNATCPGYKDGSIKLLATGGTVPYSYSINDTTFIAGNLFGALAKGTYTIYIQDANGCTNDTTITLNGLPEIVIDSVGITQPLCTGDNSGSLSVVASGGAQPLTYQLGLNAAHTPTAIFSALYAGLYTIYVTDSRNCTNDTAVVLPQPDSLNITTAVTPNQCVGNIIQGAVMATVTGGTPPYTYLWSTNPQQTTAGIINLVNGYYTVWVKDANNCTDSIVSEVLYDDCCTPFIPSAFTPNGDGKDDIFRMRFKGDMYIVIFSVYNRFGQEVFTESNTADVDNGWNGKFQGVPADLGTYYYYAKIKCGNKGDHEIELKGDVTLIR